MNTPINTSVSVTRSITLRRRLRQGGALAIALCCPFLGGPLSLRAAVQPVLFTLFVTPGGVPATNSYTVPAGKVLIIQNMRLLYGSSSLTVLVDSNTVVHVSSADFTSGTPGSVPPFLTLPLKIPAGCTLYATAIPPSTSANIPIFGLVADVSDLYAPLSYHIENPSVKSGLLAFDIKMDSPAPALIQVQTTLELTNGWTNSTSATVARTADPERYSVTVPAVGDKEFVRAKATVATK